ncbi:hypothetical protein GGR56DRAFT_617870 [Xylariaceae sp. FL0804]|nr:hypothetical protein GGR56DRAFT_617870 [Xylariaceae sp. FL0804]
MSQSSQLPAAVLDGPALAPPPGHVSNFDNSWNLNGVAEAANAACVVATVLVVAARFYDRVYCMRKILLEDMLALAGLVTYFAAIGCSYRITLTVGQFTHMWDIRLRDIAAPFYVYHLGDNFFAVTIGFTKAAILVEWNRIFVPPGTRNSFYWICKAILVLSSLISVAYVVAENMSCFPHAKIYNPLITEGYCINQTIWQVPGAIGAVLCTVFIIVLPQHTIWRLQMPRKNRVGISLIFMVGLLALGTSIARTVSTFEYIHSSDKTYTITRTYLWALAEMTCYNLAFCAPAIPRVFTNSTPVSRGLGRAAGWLGVPQKPARPRPMLPSWPSTPARHNKRNKRNWDTSKAYRQITDYAIGTRDSEGGLQHQHPSDPTVPTGAILMTTHFTAEVTMQDHELKGNAHSREYPWASD